MQKQFRNPFQIFLRFLQLILQKTVWNTTIHKQNKTNHISVIKDSLGSGKQIKESIVHGPNNKKTNIPREQSTSNITKTVLLQNSAQHKYSIAKNTQISLKITTNKCQIITTTQITPKAVTHQSDRSRISIRSRNNKHENKSRQSTINQIHQLA